MQDKYVGDVGDYGKYGMLNAITNLADGGIRLGVCWCLTTIEEPGNKDGKHTNYLEPSYKNSEKYRKCFPDLYGQIKNIVDNKPRMIATIERENILQKDTIFYSEVMPCKSFAGADKIRDRETWFEKALQRLKEADIVFFDPDNAVYNDEKMKRHKKAVKYIFRDEIEAFFKLGKTIIVYNHKDFSPKQKYDEKIRTGTQIVQSPDEVRVLRSRRFTVRDYIFLVQEKHKTFISNAFEELTRTPKDFLFEEYFLT